MNHFNKLNFWPENPYRRIDIVNLPKHYDALACRLHRAMLSKMTVLLKEGLRFANMGTWGEQKGKVEVAHSVKDWENISLSFDDAFSISDQYQEFVKEAAENKILGWIIAQPVLVNAGVVGYTIHGGTPAGREQVIIFKTVDGCLLVVRVGKAPNESMQDLVGAISEFTNDKTFALHQVCLASYAAQAKYKVISRYLQDMG